MEMRNNSRFDYNHTVGKIRTWFLHHNTLQASSCFPSLPSCAQHQIFFVFLTWYSGKNVLIQQLWANRETWIISIQKSLKKISVLHASHQDHWCGLRRLFTTMIFGTFATKITGSAGVTPEPSLRFHHSNGKSRDLWLFRKGMGNSLPTQDSYVSSPGVRVESLFSASDEQTKTK